MSHEAAGAGGVGGSSRLDTETAARNGVWFAAGLSFAVAVAVVTLQDWPVRSWMILCTGLLLVALRHRSLALAFEVFVVDWLGRMPFGDEPVRHTAIVTAVLLLTGYGPSRLTRALVPAAGVAWFVIAVGIPGECSPYGRTEYGQPYQPRWPEFVVKSREELDALRSKA